MFHDLEYLNTMIGIIILNESNFNQRLNEFLNRLKNNRELGLFYFRFERILIIIRRVNF